MFSWHTLTDGNTSELCVYSGWPLIFWWLLAVPTANREKFTHDISTNLCFFCMWNFVEVEAYIEVHYLCNISASQYLFMHLMFVIYSGFSVTLSFCLVFSTTTLIGHCVCCADHWSGLRNVSLYHKILDHCSNGEKVQKVK